MKLRQVKNLRFCLRFPFVSMAAFLHCVLLGHILALLGLTVPARAFLVVNMSLGVHPYHAWGGARSRSGAC